MGAPGRRLVLLLTLLAALRANAADERTNQPAEPTTETTTPPPTGQVTERKVDYALLPGLSFASDIGWGFGLAAAMYVRSPGFTPYKYMVQVKAFATTGGVQNHALKLDAPRLFGSTYRPIVSAGFFRDSVRPYFGVGNESSSAVPTGSTKKETFTYGLTSLYGLLGVEKRLGGPWKANVLYELRSQSVDVRPGSKLAQDAPPGTDGGPIGRMDVELIYDTRDVENSTTRGVYASVSAHGASKVLGSAFTYGGFASEIRGFASLAKLGPGLVLAGRLLGDVTWGDMPVAELPLFGGRSRIEGVGGVDSLRGLDRYRYVGQAKVLLNVELRSRVFRFTVRQRPLDLWGVAFADTGRVWAQVASDGPFWKFHYSRGAGVRVAWVEDFIVRVDVGFGEGRRALYASLDQTF